MPDAQSHPNTSIEPPPLGVQATVFMDRELDSPCVLDVEMPSLVEAEEWLEEHPPLGLLGNIDIVSHWTLHVALYALQNPTPENIERALAKIGISGDCEEHVDFETLKPLPVSKPNGWDD